MNWILFDVSCRVFSSTNSSWGLSSCLSFSSSDRITDALLSQLSDKNWKVRNEGLQKVTEILKEAKFVTANLGGLPEAIKARLGESNKNLVNSWLDIHIKVAMQEYTKVFNDSCYCKFSFLLWLFFSILFSTANDIHHYLFYTCHIHGPSKQTACQNYRSRSYFLPFR